MSYPACFDSEAQFTDWKKLARASNFHSLSSVCADCTHAYKDRMVQEERCSEPRVTFKMIKGELVGELPDELIKAISKGRYKWGTGGKIINIVKGYL